MFAKTAANQDTRTYCIDALTKAGVSKDVGEFYAEATQCECDITTAICRIRKELLSADAAPTNVTLLCNVIQIKIKEGDEITIVDATQPNKLKVRTAEGNEGYIPTVSCLLPAPDINSSAVLDRVQVYILMCWYECDTKAKAAVRKCLTSTITDILSQLKVRLANGGQWEDRVARRLKRILETTSTTSGSAKGSENSDVLDCNKLHKILTSLENEFSAVSKNSNFAKIADTVAEMDKVVLYYQIFRRHWRLFRQSIKDSSTGIRAFRLQFNWDPSIFADPSKTYKYYEVKLTTEEKTVREETFVHPANDVSDGADEDEEQIQAVTTKQVHHMNSRSKPDQEDQDQSEFDEIWSKTKTVKTTVTHSSSHSSSGTGNRPSSDVTDSGSGDSGKSKRRIVMASGARVLLQGECGETVTNEETTTEQQSSYGVEFADRVTTVAPDVEQRAFVGGTCRQSVDSEQIVLASHEETKKFFIRGVLDPRNGHEMTMDEAVAAGIVDPQQGVYINPLTGQSEPIAVAMIGGRILIEHVTTTRTPEKTVSLGLITIRTETDTHEYSITAAIDTANGQKVDIEEARRRGIIDEHNGIYWNTMTKRKMDLDDAIDVGLIFIEFLTDRVHTSPRPVETKTYAVSSVVDQITRRAVPFAEAVSRGLIDRETGSYVNNSTGELVFAGEAIRRGFFKGHLVDDPKSLVGIDVANKVVVDRIDRVRKNIKREIKTVSAFKQAAAANK